MSLRIIEDEYHITPKGKQELLGWYRWPNKNGTWGKYHAFLLNHPKNYKHPKDDGITVWSACNQNGTTIKADFEQDPKLHECCKLCLKELRFLGIDNPSTMIFRRKG